MIVMLERILLNFIIWGSIVFLPWFFYFPIIILGLFLFNNFFEGFFWTILLDFSFGLKIYLPFFSLNFYFIHTVILLILFFIVEYFKNRMRMF